MFLAGPLARCTSSAWPALLLLFLFTAVHGNETGANQHQNEKYGSQCIMHGGSSLDGPLDRCLTSISIAVQPPARL
jgi:hypothetical protein